MELRQARLAILAIVFAVAGCAQLPAQQNTASSKEVVPARQAPSQLSSATNQLDQLSGAARADTALAWAQYYLTHERVEDAGELLDRVGNGNLDQTQRYNWLRLRAQAWLASQHPDRALALLDQYSGTTSGFDAQRRAGLNLLRADALYLDGQMMASLEERVAVDPLLGSGDQSYNRKLTWETLMALPLQTLEENSANASGDLRGWLELAQLYRDPQANLDGQINQLQDWRSRWPNHPAAEQLPGMVNAMQTAARERPSHVAVLLPESGPLAGAAQAIRDGLMTGYYSARDAGNSTPELRFYDVSGGDPQAVYQRAVTEGAEFVIGPLAKDNVAALAAMGTPPVTTLALNYLDQNSENAPLFQFGLAPEDEARQAARQALREGHRYAGVLYPETEWGLRISQAFMTEWQQGGGQIAAQNTFSDDSIGESVKALMGQARSHQSQQGYGGGGGEYEPHVGQDMSFVFLVANPNEGRQIKPALNFHYARYLPVYSTSYIYDGTPAPRRDQDLDGVRFLDMPWVLYTDSRLHQRAAETWPEGHGRYTRLFAMGVDAYRLQARLSMLRHLPDSRLPGITGNLHLNGARLVRESNWAVFRHGEPTPLPQISGASGTDELE
ncbi:penicillin-binding protein activator [Alloalcanivorax mobilis]|uniref:penicillin-binding protein activator n=1 Tax=Alloalcanivorax mobilis TaxID=2019569 RepID=UPI0012FFFA4F|nr:penicillin-binding protein activator [Alloalcanivorax mobilis]